MLCKLDNGHDMRSKYWVECVEPCPVYPHDVHMGPVCTNCNVVHCMYCQRYLSIVKLGARA